MTDIVIAGAGTTGWLTALYIKGHFSESNVTVIYDDKIPNIGVGESTTPNFLSFTEKTLRISTGELIKNCEATLKNGIKFTNWTGDGSYYYHTFTHGEVDKYCSALSSGIHIDEIDLGSILSERNKVPYPNIGVRHDGNYKDSSLALHFNAKLMAEYLQKVAVERGIETVVGNIEDVILDNDGYVDEIILDSKRRVKTDFVFDCTGFSRVFVDKVYKSPMDSYETLLPVKRAMPFFLDNTDSTPPYTEAIAMKYGWMWKIPVGNRYGCGYVFDSDLTTDEEAYKEICEITGQKPEIRKKINFRPEYYTKPFNKNTIALGLAHGFLEPLEATSIMMTIDMLNVLEKTIPHGNLIHRENRDEYTKDFNRLAEIYTNNCVNFVKLHYLTSRNDTEFWKKGRDNIPESLKKTLKLVDEYDFKKPNELRSHYPFPVKSLIQCISGVNRLGKDMIERNTDEYVVSEVCNLIPKNKYIAAKSLNHDERLNFLTNN